MTNLNDVNQYEYFADAAQGRCVVPNPSTAGIMGTVRFRMAPHRTMIMSVTGAGTRTGHDTERLMRIEPLSEAEETHQEQ